MLPLRYYYKKLSSESRGHYWNIVTNMLLVVITFFLGLNIQNEVAEKSADASRKLAHYQIVDELYPVFVDFFEYNPPLITDLFSWSSTADISDQGHKRLFHKLIEDDKDDIILMAKHVVDTMGRYKYYFEEKNFDKVSDNNTKIRVGIELMDFIQRKTNLTKEEIRNHVVIFTNTSKYLLEARSLTKPLELADKIHDLMNLKVPHDSIESKIMEMFILTPMLENIQVLKKELNFAKYNKRNISPWYILIIVLVFSVIVCNLFAKWIAPEKNTINPDEIERMKRTIKEQNETIADHKAEMSKNRILMCAQNDQMDYLDSTIRDQEAYIQKLEEQINNNDTKITAPE